MWAMLGLVLDVFGEHGFEMTSVEDQHSVKALPTDRADETLGEGIGPRARAGVRTT
jgi:hypothetical protein